ncbi:MAG: metallophosphoesterase, partial [Clostridia bacterium]|nr:metallophosphoesterase [Clostridia bacterium]
MKPLKHLTLLHSNDLHGDFLAEEIEETFVGGISLLSGYISKVRGEETAALYAVSGDLFRGSIIDAEYKGLSTIEMMNLLSPDVVTLGNHEIDYGIAHLLFIEKCALF